MSKAGNVTVRYPSRLRHIASGKAHAGEPVRLLIADDHVGMVRQDGSLLRELVLDISRDYQPRLELVLDVVRQVSTMSRERADGRGERTRAHAFQLSMRIVGGRADRPRLVRSA